MIQLKIYRWFQVLRGARSFVKQDKTTEAYILMHGECPPRLLAYLESQGYKEEWSKRASDI